MKKTANLKIWKMMSLLLCLGIFVFTSCDPEAWLPDDDDPENVDPGQDDDDPPVVVEGDWTKPINEAIVWDGNFSVKGTVYVNAELTIKPGSIIVFHEDAQLYVQNEGTIKAEGTAEKPITFKAREKGADWKHIYINSNAGKSSKFAYCHISGAETGIYVYQNKVSVDNCVIKECSVNGVYLHGESEFGSFTANTISDCEEYPLVIPFLQATAVTSDNEISGIGIALSGYQVGKKNGKVTIHEQTIPYVITQSYVEIDDNAEVTIEPGVTIAMGEDSYISVGYTSSGKLTAVGTEEKPITFTSNAKDKAAGDWGEIRFYEYASKSSALKYCNLEYSGAHDNGAVYLYYTKIAIDSCTITNSSSYGVLAHSESSFTSFTGNVIKDNELCPVRCSAAAAGAIAADNELDALGVEINSYELTEKVTWVNLKVPFTIKASYLEIVDGGSLTIEPGVTVQLAENTNISVGYYSEGKLVAEGTAEEPIIFTSAMNDKYPGDWDNIRFYEHASAGCILDHCKILYGGDDGNSLYLYYCDAKVTIQNCEIAYSDGYGIYVNNASPTMSNNTYHDNKDGNKINGTEYLDSEM